MIPVRGVARFVAVGGIVALAASVGAASAGATEASVDLALVLALDSSASVDADEFESQRGGLAAAFRDKEVVEAIAAGPQKRIAVTVVEWAGATQQVIAVEWTMIEDIADSLALADRIDAMERSIPTGATSISGALVFGNALLRAVPFEATRRVIDLSGDGRNNQGQNVEDVRRVVLAHGVTINGLAILNEHPTLNYYFQDRVVGGPGAFVEIAHDYSDYIDAIRRKLVREIRSLTVSDAGGAGDLRAATPLPESGTRMAAGPPPSR